ncbi:MAG: AAA family ATPase [Candidatus Aminicenantes bacterium]|nr:AAA family ATPase [Candidatus Aminicenantes bacterium]
MAAASLCIGLTGRMASGKGEAVRILGGHGFTYVSLSDIVRQEAARQRRAVSRDRMQDIGNRLRAEGGAGVLGRRVRERIAASDPACWVIDGIRNPAEVLELKKMGAFFLVAIECDIAVILARMKRRGRTGDAVSEEELRAALDREWGKDEPEDGQQVGRTMALADFIVSNNGTLAELKGRLEAVLTKLGVEA